MPQKTSFSGRYVKANRPVRQAIVSYIDGLMFQDGACRIVTNAKATTTEVTTACGLYGARQTPDQLAERRQKVSAAMRDNRLAGIPLTRLHCRLGDDQ